MVCDQNVPWVKPPKRRRRRTVAMVAVLTTIAGAVVLTAHVFGDTARNRVATPAGTSTGYPSARLLLHQTSPPTPADIVRSHAAIDALPFDGLVIASDASNAVMRNTVLDADALSRELSVLTPGLLPHLTHNFLLAYATPAGPFADFHTTVAVNFGVLARAAREASFVGIFFDVEEYFGSSWEGHVGCPGLDIETCRREARSAGAAVMAAIAANWPDAKLLVTSGPSISDPFTHKALNPPAVEDVSASNPMYGAFAVGLAEGTIGTRTTLIDGGAVYTQRTTADVARTTTWLTTGIAAHGSIVPPDLRSRYPTLISPSMGVFDFPTRYRGKGPGTPATWERDIGITLLGVRDYAWVYSERFNWASASRDTVHPAPPDEWIRATERGRVAGRR
jgi:hypothetical protein